jgi:adenine-specific DNA-methyltransferase
VSKIKEALDILVKMGLPKKQQNDRSALTLLALLDLKEDTPWVEAKQRMIIIHDIMTFIKDNYDVVYAENSRETIRRQTLHQFEHAALAIRNMDQSDRATNSPKNNYAVTTEALCFIKKYSMDGFISALDEFALKQGRLIDQYDKIKTDCEIQIKIDNGFELSFTPGKHNELQVKIIESLYPRFFSKAKLLYVGDCAHKLLHANYGLIKELNIPLTGHDKLPDLVFYGRERNVLFLVEAVTSHGPVSPKRQKELEESLVNCNAKRIYISAFPNFKEFKRHIDEIVWESEVWIADNPDHMVHFNGEKFLYAIED